MGGTTLVLYHGDCPDGFGAAYAAWRALGDAATYLPVRHGEPPPPEAEAGPERLYLLDFAYPRATTERLAARAGSARVLDHHATAAEDLAGLPFVTIDLDRSGAVLAWEHFHPGRPVPLLLRYVEDRDLWRWELPRSREVNAALALVPFDFAAWDAPGPRPRRRGRRPAGGAGGPGATIVAYRATQVRRLCDSAFWAEVAGLPGPGGQRAAAGLGGRRGAVPPVPRGPVRGRLLPGLGVRGVLVAAVAGRLRRGGGRPVAGRRRAPGGGRIQGPPAGWCHIRRIAGGGPLLVRTIAIPFARGWTGD